MRQGSPRRPLPVWIVMFQDVQGTRAAMRNARLVSWIRRTALRVRRVTSVCSGAFLLGEAGLLDGRRATTHWAVCDALQQRYPKARVERDPIFVRDGKVSTSAGVTAGMDLALELVEEDGGRDLALSVARWLVMFLRRPGGQSQFSVQLSAQVAERRGLRDPQTWIADHLGDDLSVPALARRAGMSPRNFARAFRSARPSRRQPPCRRAPPAPARSDRGLSVAYAPPTRLPFGVVQSLATFSCYAYASGRRWI